MEYQRQADRLSGGRKGKERGREGCEAKERIRQEYFLKLAIVFNHQTEVANIIQAQEHVMEHFESNSISSVLQTLLFLLDLMNLNQ